MHIGDGFLPLSHCAAWGCLAAPFLYGAARRLRSPAFRLHRMELAAATGSVLLLTSLRLPSIAGSCSHPTGVALAAILLGPRVVPALVVVVLLLQALLLGHGGVTTLGANLVSLGVAGPYLAYLVYVLLHRLSVSLKWAGAAAAFVASVGVYATAALQMAYAHPDPVTGTLGAASRFLLVFAWTQVPVALLEAAFTAYALRRLRDWRAQAPIEMHS
jgi:cobalt/nickel transport system permease protein